MGNDIDSDRKLPKMQSTICSQASGLTDTWSFIVYETISYLRLSDTLSPLDYYSM